MWLAENIQACLRIFRRPQHLWLARDILHQPQGVFYVFVLWPRQRFKRFKRFNGFKSVQSAQSVQSVQSVIEKESRGQGFLRFLYYDQPRTRHKSAPSVAEQLSIERVLISVLSGFFILHYIAKMGIQQKINANRRYFSIIDFCIARCQVRSKPF